MLLAALAIPTALVLVNRTGGGARPPGPTTSPAATTTVAPTASAAPSERRVTVPGVVGSRPPDARRSLEEVGLQAELALPPSADAGLVAAGRVTSATPPPGSAVAPGTVVTLEVACTPTCVSGSPATAAPGRPCEYPGAPDAPVVEPTRVAAGADVRVRGPAFGGEPTVRVLVGPRAEVAGPGAMEVARTRARAAPDCTYELSFTAPSPPGEYSVFIVLEPAVRIEPPFDLTVT